MMYLENEIERRERREWGNDDFGMAVALKMLLVGLPGVIENSRGSLGTPADFQHRGTTNCYDRKELGDHYWL